MYSWNYIKNLTLMKLDLEEDEGNALNLISRFKYYANEAMTIICSTVKPKRLYGTVSVNKDMVGKAVKATNDPNFIGFGDDVNTITINEFGLTITEKTHDTNFLYHGYNEIIPFSEGIYNISYNARWIDFVKMTSIGISDDDELEIPTDVLECLPSYIASQCMKVDDDYKASVFRNEFEMLLARMDDTNYKTNKTFTIGGDW